MDVNKLQAVSKEFTLLYAEDEPNLRRIMREYLENFFASVEVVEDGEAALQRYNKQKFDLVITDINMPKMNGIEFSKKVLEENPEQEIIILSAHSESEYLLDCIALGINGYIVKPIIYDQITDVLYKSVIKLKRFKESELYTQSLHENIRDKTTQNNILNDEKIENYDKTIKSLVTLLEERDSYTAGHSQRVAEYSSMIAQAMGYSKQECSQVYEAAILHDIGKISTPDSILLRPGKLNDLEYSLIKEHVSSSKKILSEIPMYANLVDIVAAHHEHYDGSGYPLGLKGDEIPPLAHIMIICDAFDAMTTNRIYKGRQSVQSALDELQACSGRQFHPNVVNAAQETLCNIVLTENNYQLPITVKEKERFSYFFKDQITGLYNQEYLDLIWNHKSEFPSYKTVVILSLEHFNQYNITHGWEQGDKLLKKYSNFLLKLDHVEKFRLFGDIFLLLVTKEKEESIKKELTISLDESISIKIEYYDIKENNLDDIDVLYDLIKIQ